MTSISGILPFVIATLLYIYFNDPDDICYGLVHLVQNVLLYAFLTLGLLLAAIAIYKKRQVPDVKFEPVSFTIIFFSMTTLCYHFTFCGHTNGDKFLTAENRDIDFFNEKKVLTLRKNGNFTIEFI